MNNNVQPWYCSGWAIVIAFIFFWPVGIALLILRNSKNKQSVFLGTTDKKKYIIAGVILILIGMAYFSANVIIGAFMIVGGVALLAYAEKLKRKAERNRQYIDLIVNQDENSLDKIANICNVQYDIVVKELRSLISKNVLKNATIDENYRIITFEKVEEQPQVDTFKTIGNVFSGATASNEQVNCVCSGCGAKVVLLKGTSKCCEYCDTPIVAN